MLRVTIHDSSTELRLHLEGRLAGAWVQEAELCWKTAQSTVAGRSVVLDLLDVDFVDERGEQLLISMHRQGVKLRAASPMMTHLIAEIAGTAEDRTEQQNGQEARPRPAMLP